MGSGIARRRVGGEAPARQPPAGCRGTGAVRTGEESPGGNESRHEARFPRPRPQRRLRHRRHGRDLHAGRHPGRARCAAGRRQRAGRRHRRRAPCSAWWSRRAPASAATASASTRPAGAGKVVALNGSGRAPAAATPEALRARGVEALTPTSPHSVTVPGAISAWALLNRTHGRKELGELLRPAIRCAEEGWPVHARVALDWAGAVEKLRGNEASRRRFLSGGEAPPVGHRFVQPELGRTLRAIAERGPRAFYEGEIAASMVSALRDGGRAAHRGRFRRRAGGRRIRGADPRALARHGGGAVPAQRLGHARAANPRHPGGVRDACRRAAQPGAAAPPCGSGAAGLPRPRRLPRRPVAGRTCRSRG